MEPINALVVRLLALRQRLAVEDDGFSTAELLGNAALGVVALVVIWGLLRTLGVDLVEMIREELMSGGGAS